MENKQEKIKQVVQKLLDLMMVQATISTEDREGHLYFNIKSDDSNLLIGQYGQALKSFQHIVRLLVRKEEEKEGLENPTLFSIDVGDYRRERGEFLEALARKAASRVRETQQDLILKPMNSSDRKMIHMSLSASDDLITESIGDEPERRIKIKLKV